MTAPTPAPALVTTVAAMADPQLAPVPILLYHSVNPDPSEWIAPFTVTPATFAQHLDAVLASGRTAVTASELVVRRRLGTATGAEVVITFDDGFADFATHALPALVERGLPATLYVTTGALRDGRERRACAPFIAAPMLSWRQLGELEDAAVELGAHTRTHCQLDLVPTCVVRDEIAGSKADLEDILGHPVESFAYPHGYSTRRIEAITRIAGFSSAYRVCNRLSSATDDPFRVARLMIMATTSLGQVTAWVGGLGPVSGPGGRLASWIWRGARALRPQPRVVFADGATTGLVPSGTCDNQTSDGWSLGDSLEEGL